MLESRQERPCPPLVASRTSHSLPPARLAGLGNHRQTAVTRYHLCELFGTERYPKQLRPLPSLVRPEVAFLSINGWGCRLGHAEAQGRRMTPRGDLVSMARWTRSMIRPHTKGKKQPGMEGRDGVTMRQYRTRS